MQIFTKTATPGERALGSPALSIRISGFLDQTTVSLEQVVSTVDALPAFHLAGLREISFSPERMPPILRPTRSNPVVRRTKAAFVERERRIEVYEVDELPAFRRVLYHEIGHFVFFAIIGSRVKKRWVTEVHPHSMCVSPYATQNAAEDFAETYACYVLDPAQLERELSEKHAFMRGNVFSAESGTLKERETHTQPGA